MTKGYHSILDFEAFKDVVLTLLNKEYPNREPLFMERFIREDTFRALRMYSTIQITGQVLKAANGVNLRITYRVTEPLFFMPFVMFGGFTFIHQIVSSNKLIDLAIPTLILVLAILFLLTIFVARYNLRTQVKFWEAKLHLLTQ